MVDSQVPNKRPCLKDKGKAVVESDGEPPQSLPQKPLVFRSVFELAENSKALSSDQVVPQITPLPPSFVQTLARMIVNRSVLRSNSFMDKYRIAEYRGPRLLYEGFDEDDKDENEVVVVFDDDNETDDDCGADFGDEP